VAIEGYSRNGLKIKATPGNDDNMIGRNVLENVFEMS
jgi:hypothetical protein